MLHFIKPYIKHYKICVIVLYKIEILTSIKYDVFENRLKRVVIKRQLFWLPI